MHATLLLPSEYEPAAHAVCAEAPAAATMKPGAAPVQDDIPIVAVYVPAAQVPQPD